MQQPSTATIDSLLVDNLTRELVMGIEDGLDAGARRAFAAANGMDEGHLPHVVGQLRHFHMNEAFHRALAANQATPSAIKGNGLVTGRAGMLTLARFNIPQGFWINGRRSHTRRQMALANAALEPLVQPGLFSTYVQPSDAVAFFVACFSGSLSYQPESPVSVQIAVPSRDMRGWLFKEPLNEFIKRYEAPAIIQTDLAVPKLKKGQSKQQDKDGTAP